MHSLFRALSGSCMQLLQSSQAMQGSNGLRVLAPGLLRTISSLAARSSKPSVEGAMPLLQHGSAFHNSQQPRSFASSAAAASSDADGSSIQGATDAKDNSSIFIRNLSWGLDDAALQRHISAEVDGLTNVRVFTKSNGRSMGMALVDFESPEAAQQAVQKLNQTDVDGRTLNVVIADPTLRNKERRDREGGGEWQRRAPREPRFGERRYNSGGGGFNDGERSERRDPSTLVVVSNLSFDLTWQELKDAFEDAGLPRPEHVNMKTTPEGRSRGMAIVAMRNAEAAERAIAELSQRELAGRPMVVRRYNVD